MIAALQVAGSRCRGSTDLAAHLSSRRRPHPGGSAVLWVNPDEFLGGRTRCVAPRLSRSLPNPPRERATWGDGGLLSPFSGGVVRSLRGQGACPLSDPPDRASRYGAPPQPFAVRSRCFAALETQITIRTPLHRLPSRCGLTYSCRPIRSYAGLRTSPKRAKPIRTRSASGAALPGTWNDTDYLIACRAAAPPRHRVPHLILGAVTGGGPSPRCVAVELSIGVVERQRAWPPVSSADQLDRILQSAPTYPTGITMEQPAPAATDRTSRSTHRQSASRRPRRSAP